jgi:hypothetical protein
MPRRRKIANRSSLMSVYRKYWRFRNEAHGLSCAETLRVIWAYSRLLDDEDFKFPADVEVSKQFLELDHKGRWITPWDLELIAKEAILNCDDFSPLGVRTARRWDTLAEFINAFKYFEHEASPVNQKNIIIELNRIAHRQFTWQKNIPAVMFPRYHKIFGTPVINNILIAETGLSIDELYLCAIAMVSCYFLEPSLDIPIPCEIPGLTNEIVKKFLALTCKPIWDLRIILRNEQRYDETFFYAYNSLRAYPIIATAMFHL